MAHPHGYLLEIDIIFTERLFQFDKQIMDLAEFFPYQPRIIGIGSHAHQSANTNMLEFGQGLVMQQLLAFLRTESVLGFLLRYMDLQ